MAKTTAADLLSRMADLGTETVSKKLAAMIYSKPGEGKTVLCVGLAQFITPPEQSILYVDSGDGWVSLDNHEGMKDRVQRLRFKDFGDFNAIIEAISKGTKTAQFDFGTVGTIIIDEHSTVNESLLDDVVRDDLGLKVGEMISDFDPKLYKPVADASVQIVNRLMALGIHVILIAHEREDKDHRNVKVTKPGYAPSSYKALAKPLHLIAHLRNEIKGTGKNTSYERTIQSHPSAMVDAKSRIGGLPLVTDTGTFVEIIGAWLNDDTLPIEDYEASEIAEDSLPTEGIPLADTTEEDDEGIVVSD